MPLVVRWEEFRMKAITIARDYGAGGRELAHRLAEVLGWEVLDREWLHRAAQIAQMPDAELERFDEKAVSMADRFRLRPPHEKYLQGLTEAARSAASQGQVVLVGRGARHLLGEMPEVFHLRLVAPRRWRVQRMARIEGCSEEVALARCVEIDRARALFTRYYFGETATQAAQYDLVANTARVPLEDLASVVAAVVSPASCQPSEPGAGRGASREGSDAPAADRPAERGSASPPGGESAAADRRRVLTLSRELGAGETGLAQTLAERLGMRLYDRELLEHQALQLGVSETELEKIDEQRASIFERFRPGSIHQRYFEALEKIIRELAERGEVILVGRGGNCFLREDSRAFHVRLVAPMPVRLRRVMEYRWVNESVARKLIAESDLQRRRYYETYFEVDWTDPLEYHMTVNSGRLGATAVDLISFAASRHWERGQ
jgi:cytidylate kinase